MGMLPFLRVISSVAETYIRANDVMTDVLPADLLFVSK